MRVLHLGPLWFPVSQNASGGRETFLAALINELEKTGVRNTLLASGDSLTTTELIPVVPRNLVAMMKEGGAFELAYYREHQVSLALERAHEFDLIHSHLSPGAYALSAVPGIGSRVLHTQHTPVWADLQWMLRQRPELWLSCVSHYQAQRLREGGARRVQVIPNGVDPNQFTFQPKGKGLVFLGRIESCKGPDLAVQIAQKIRQPLTLAGPIIDQDLFDKTIQPHLGEQIRYVGPVNHQQKNQLLGAAACALLPFRGAEGFGMVSIEAMACGTPVVALANGALPEVVESGITGYLTTHESELAELTLAVGRLDRAQVREHVKSRFGMRVVAEKYLRLYQQIVAETKLKQPH